MRFPRCLALLLCLVCCTATAQTYPSRPIRMIVPQAPGSASDTVARIISVARSHGRTVGLFTPRAGDVAAWRAKGASLFLLGSDHGFLRSGAQQLREQAQITD